MPEQLEPWGIGFHRKPGSSVLLQAPLQLHEVFAEVRVAFDDSNLALLECLGEPRPTIGPLPVVAPIEPRDLGPCSPMVVKEVPVHEIEKPPDEIAPSSDVQRKSRFSIDFEMNVRKRFFENWAERGRVMVGTQVPMWLATIAGGEVPDRDLRPERLEVRVLQTTFAKMNDEKQGEVVFDGDPLRTTEILDASPHPEVGGLSRPSPRRSFGEVRGKEIRPERRAPRIV